MQPIPDPAGTYFSRLPPQLQREVHRYHQSPRRQFRPILTEQSDIRGTYFQRLPRELRNLTQQYWRSCNYKVETEYIGIVAGYYSALLRITPKVGPPISIIFDEYVARGLKDFTDGVRDEIVLSIIPGGALVLRRDDSNVYLIQQYKEKRTVIHSFPICADLIYAMVRISTWF